MNAKPLWDKNLPLDKVIHRFTVGDDPLIDLHLVPYDLLGTAAHVRMLASIGQLSSYDTQKIISGLEELLSMHAEGKFVIGVVELRE